MSLLFVDLFHAARQILENGRRRATAPQQSTRSCRTIRQVWIVRLPSKELTPRRVATHEQQFRHRNIEGAFLSNSTTAVKGKSEFLGIRGLVQ